MHCLVRSNSGHCIHTFSLNAKVSCLKTTAGFNRIYISVFIPDIVSVWPHFAGWMWDSNLSNSSLSLRSPLPSKVLYLFLLADRAWAWSRDARWLAGGARMICSEFSRSTSDEECEYKTVWASHPLLFLITHKPFKCVIKVSQRGWVNYWKFKLSAFSFFLSFFSCYVT